MVGFKFFFYQPVLLLTKVVFSAGSVSTHGTSISSNAGWFAELIKCCEMVL